MLKTGFGRVEITPPLGAVLQGYFRPRVSEKVHDPLFASAVAVEDGSRAACIVSCDLIGISGREQEEAARLIKEKTGIPEERILICATHTHTGPVTQEKISPGFGDSIDVQWLSFLPRQICSAAEQAFNTRMPSGAAWLSGREEGVSFNRRFHMSDGSVKTNPGRGSSEAVRPAGPADPELGLVVFGGGVFDIHGLIANFSLHLDTVSGNQISADFPGVMREYVRGSFGMGAGFVYTSGAMGDINHVDVEGSAGSEYGYFEYASRIGSILGAEAVKTVHRAGKFTEEAKVDGGRVSVDLPLKECSCEAVERARRVVSEADAGMRNQEYIDALGILKAAALGGGKYRSQVCALRIGGAAFVGIPGEYFAELGLVIKEKSPFEKTFVVELALDCLGYIPTEKAYGQGGYEPGSSPLAPGSGELFAEKAVELLGKLKG